MPFNTFKGADQHFERYPNYYNSRQFLTKTVVFRETMIVLLIRVLNQTIKTLFVCFYYNSIVKPILFNQVQLTLLTYKSFCETRIFKRNSNMSLKADISHIPGFLNIYIRDKNISGVWSGH